MKNNPLSGFLTLVLVATLHGAGIARAADALTPLQVAYAGSMASMMDGGVKPAVAKSLDADLQGRAQGSTGLANLIVAGSIRLNVFISVTPGPMRSVLKAAKADKAVPIARTEMVIAYSPLSRYAAAFEKSRDPRSDPWWKILDTGTSLRTHRSQY